MSVLRRRADTEQQPWTPNMVVAQRIADARRLRGWTQDEAARHLEPHFGYRWSAATFSIVERSVDGKRIRQFSADELVALARGFDLPVSWFLTPPFQGESELLKTPDAPDGQPMQALADALLGTDESFEEWANELLLWGATAILRIDTSTGKVVDQRRSAPSNKPRVEQLAKLRAELAARQHFGDLATTASGLRRVLEFLEQLSSEAGADMTGDSPRERD